LARLVRLPCVTMKHPFEQAVQRHGETVLRVCRAVLGPGADADDAWSETFLAALQAWPDLEEDTNVEAWLVRVAHRKAIDITRARVRHAAPTDELPEHPSCRGNPGGDEYGIWAAVAALPERQRLAIAYHYLGGLPHAETAGLIGGSTDAVRRAAADGLKTLRRTLHAGQRPEGAPR
jgi:RNA polymerase sigma factor (sigma-70 family)